MRHIPLPLASLLLSGCLTTANQEIIEVQLDATRTALSARQAACNEKILGYQANVAALGEEIASRQAQLDAYTERLAFLEGEVSSLDAQRAEWLAVQPDPTIPPTKGKEEEAVRPLIDATAQDMRDALAARRELEERIDRRARHDIDARAAFAAITDSERGELFREGDDLVIRISASMLYNEGTVTLSPRGEAILGDLAAGLAQLGHHHVEVVGHTDNLPVHTAQHPSNWELGFARAVGVVRGLQAEHVPMTPVATSAAGTIPLAQNDTPEGRKTNARVEIVLHPAPDVLEWYAPTPADDASQAPSPDAAEPAPEAPAEPDANDPS